MNPILARAFCVSLRPRVRFGLVGAVLLVLAAAWGLAHVPPAPIGLRVGRGYVELCRAELLGLLLVVGIGGAAAIASERQDGTWDVLAASPLSDTGLVLGKAAGVLLPAALLASLLIPVHMACGVAWDVPWSIIVDVEAIFLGAGVVAAGLSLLCSAVCHRLLHAVALTAAAIVLGWFTTLDGLASGWTSTRFARIGHPLRLFDDLFTFSVSVEVAELRVLAFLLGAGLACGLALVATIRLARCSVQGRALALPGLFRLRAGNTQHVWDEPVYWRECCSRGARRTLRIGGLLILGLAIGLTVAMRDPTAGSLWAQVVGLTPNYMNLLIKVGSLLLCLRSSVSIADERRGGMLAPLALAGMSPARIVGSKLKGDLRPAVPLTAIVVVIWVADTGTMFHDFTDSRLWWDALGVLAAVGAGYFLAVSLGLLASAYSPSPRVALFAGPALLFAWGSAGPLVPEIVRLVWPRTSVETQMRLGHLIGGDAGMFVNLLTFHVARSKIINRASWVVPWVAVVMLVGLAAWIAAVFRVSRENGRRARRSARIPPGPAYPRDFP